MDAKKVVKMDAKKVVKAPAKQAAYKVVQVVATPLVNQAALADKRVNGERE
jgi:hypothetical protein